RAALVTGNLADAEVFVRKALKADSNDQEAKIAGAQIAAQAAEWERAIELINSVAQNSPETLSRAVSQWHPQLQPPVSTTVWDQQRSFLIVCESRRVVAIL